MIMNAKKRVEKPYKKVLKSCTRCRQHKTKCDAAIRKPMPCSHCARKSIACILEIIDTPPKRSSDVIEQLSSDVAKLKGSLSVMIVRRSKMINGLLQRSGLQPVQLSEVEPEFLVEEREEYEDEDEDENDDEEEDDEEEDEEDEDHEIEYVDGDMDVDAVEENKEEDEEEEGEEEEDEEEGDVDVDVDVDVEICGNTNPDDCETVTTVIENPSFSHSLSSTASFILDSIELTRLQAAELFSNYNAKFHKFIPILPDQFLYDLDQVYEESDLLFWSIIVVSLMDRDFHELNFKFLDLVRAIKLLVVTKCWYNTPRSVHTLLSLSILTTWPLPLTTSPINDGGSGISLKYLALMEDLSLQLGLHKSEFIDEFSHKTQVGISKYSSDNNKVIRERIYKYISIQANFWLTFLGFPQNKEEDYIIDKATRQQRLPMLLPLFLSETTKGSSVSRDESFINTTLKLSSIQLKMSKVFESADNSITRLYQINKSKRFLNIGMFEVILKQLSKLCASTPIYQLTIEYTKLQLYLFAFPPLDKFKTDLNLTNEEYKQYTQKALCCCYSIVNLFIEEFQDRCILSIPIHYRFSLEVSLLVMMKIHYSPLLNSVREYINLKAQFKRAYMTLNDVPPDGSCVKDINKILSVLQKYELQYQRNKQELLLCGIHGENYYLLKGSNDFLVSSLFDEMKEKSEEELNPPKHLECIEWSKLGLKKEIPKQKEVIDYLENDCFLI